MFPRVAAPDAVETSPPAPPPGPRSPRRDCGPRSPPAGPAARRSRRPAPPAAPGPRPAGSPARAAGPQSRSPSHQKTPQIAHSATYPPSVSSTASSAPADRAAVEGAVELVPVGRLVGVRPVRRPRELTSATGRLLADRALATPPGRADPPPAGGPGRCRPPASAARRAAGRRAPCSSPPGAGGGGTRAARRRSGSGPSRSGVGIRQVMDLRLGPPDGGGNGLGSNPCRAGI